jgi:hypothetical protein
MTLATIYFLCVRIPINPGVGAGSVRDCAVKRPGDDGTVVTDGAVTATGAGTAGAGTSDGSTLLSALPQFLQNLLVSGLSVPHLPQNMIFFLQTLDFFSVGINIVIIFIAQKDS